MNIGIQKEGLGNPQPIEQFQVIDARKWHRILLQQIGQEDQSIKIKGMYFQVKERKSTNGQVIEEPDTAVNAIFDALLAKKAERGEQITIHLQFDNETLLEETSVHGSDREEKLKRIEQLREAGIIVSIIERNPLQQAAAMIPVVGKISAQALRDHRKVAILGDRVAFMGGVNFSSHDFSRPDLMVAITEPEMIQQVATHVFDTVPKHGDIRHEFNDSGRTVLVVDAGMPTRSENQAEAIEIIGGAQEGDTLYISSGFFPNGKAEKEFQAAAAERGVQVVIVVSQEQTVAGEPVMAHSITQGVRRNRDYKNIAIIQKEEWVHAKLVLHKPSEGSGREGRALVTSSNLYSLGVWAGTIEAGIASSDPQFVRNVQTFIDTVLLQGEEH